MGFVIPVISCAAAAATAAAAVAIASSYVICTGGEGIDLQAVRDGNSVMA